MNLDVIFELAEKLTGSPVKDVLSTDRHFLESILQDDSRVIDCSQLNELLLLINKDRMERPFFKYFFGNDCKISDLPAKVNRFQQTAMLHYGNFIYAYRSLSRLKTDGELSGKLGELSENPDTLRSTFAGRSPKLLEIETVPKEDTHLLGYLSAGEIIAEFERARLMKTCLCGKSRTVLGFSAECSPTRWSLIWRRTTAIRCGTLGRRFRVLFTES